MFNDIFKSQNKSIKKKIEQFSQSQLEPQSRNVDNDSLIVKNDKNIYMGNSGAAFKNDGTVILWGNHAYKIYSFRDSFIPNFLGYDNITEIYNEELGISYLIMNNITKVQLENAHGILLTNNSEALIYGDNRLPEEYRNVIINNVKDFDLSGSFNGALLKNDNTVEVFGNREHAGEPTFTGKVSMYNQEIDFVGLPPDSLVDVKKVIMSNRTGAVLKNDNTVLRWGMNKHLLQVNNRELTDVLDIQSNGKSSMIIAALKIDGTVLVWGDHYSLNQKIREFNDEIKKGNNINIKKIEVGNYNVILLDHDNTAHVFSNNDDTISYDNVQDISADYYYGILSEGKVLLDGKYIPDDYDQSLVNSNIIGISIGSSGAALKNDGTVVLWGRKQSGGVAIPGMELNDIKTPFNNPRDEPERLMHTSPISDEYVDCYNNATCHNATHIRIKNLRINSSGHSILDRQAFKNNTNLISVILPNNLSDIPFEAFKGCTNLVSVLIENTDIIDMVPKDYYIINNSAFEGCTSLVTVQIPEYFIELRDEVFKDCTSLETITIPSSIVYMGYAAFQGCTSLTSFVIPDSVTTISNSVFQNCTSLSSIQIGENVENIGLYMFQSCSLTSVDIPNSVKRIENFAFNQCTSLQSITMGNSIECIGESSFENCDSLASVLIPDSVESIEKQAFRKCTSLTSVVLGINLKNIGDEAFLECTEITSIVIPDSVTSMGIQVFFNCINLTSAVISNELDKINEATFISCSSLASITIGNKVKSIERAAFRGCTSLNNVIIPNSVERIEEYAFRECKSLTNIIIPDSVELNKDAFGVFSEYPDSSQLGCEMHMYQAGVELRNCNVVEKRQTTTSTSSTAKIITSNRRTPTTTSNRRTPTTTSNRRTPTTTSNRRTPTTTSVSGSSNEDPSTDKKSNTGLVVGITAGVLLTTIIVLIVLQKKGIVNLTFLSRFNARN